MNEDDGKGEGSDKEVAKEERERVRNPNQLVANLLTTVKKRKREITKRDLHIDRNPLPLFLSRFNPPTQKFKY